MHVVTTIAAGAGVSVEQVSIRAAAPHWSQPEVPGSYRLVFVRRGVAWQAPARASAVRPTTAGAGISGLAGFRGAYLLARQDEGSVAIRTLTLFDSLEAVRAFAGDDYDRERVTQQARANLLDSDPVIQHFDVLTAPR